MKKFKRAISVILCITIIFSCCHYGFLYADSKDQLVGDESIEQLLKSQSEDAYKTDRYIIKYKKNQELKKVKDKVKTELKNKVKETREVKIKDKEFEVITLKEKMKPEDFISEISSKNYQEIEYIQQDFELMIESTDPYIQVQWGLDNSDKTEAKTRNEDLQQLYEEGQLKEETYKRLMKLTDSEQPQHSEPDYKVDANILQAWEAAQGENILIAVIDSGVDTSHEDLAANIWANEKEIPGNDIDDDQNGYVDDINGWNFFGDNNQPYSFSSDSDYQYYNSHGTHVAGIIGAVKDNGIGIAGVAPKAKLLPLKVFENGKAYTSDILNAIAYAEQMGADIANCSWGMLDKNPALEDIIRNSNMLFVCAAGNSGVDIDQIPVYPASIASDNVIAVASISRTGHLSEFSNYGTSSVDIAAPGDDIYSCVPGNIYEFKNGTSMAAAFAAGEAALLMSWERGLSNAEIKARMMATSDKYSSLMDKVNGGHKINIGNAINNIENTGMIDIIGSSYTVGQSIKQKNAEGAELLSMPLVSSSSITPMISINSTHALTLKNDGIVWAWGDNYYGQLGDGSTTNRYAPVQVANLRDVEYIGTGSTHSLAIKSDKTVWAWGENYYGQLGDGTTVNRYQPIQVPGLSNVISVKGGNGFSVALKSDGTVWAWGYNSNGELGNGTTANSNVPVQVSGLSNITEIAVKYNHCLALKADGTVWAWGENYFGQLGDGTTTDRSTPAKINGLTGVTSIAVGSIHSMALKADGTVWSWGNNDYSQLGDGSFDSHQLPSQVQALNNIAEISAGEVHSIAASTDGTLYMWGSNESYQIMNEDDHVSIPTAATSINNVIAADGGWYNTMALKKDGTVWTWGINAEGILGDGSLHRRPYMNRVDSVILDNINPAKDIYSSDHMLSLGTDNTTLLSWGANNYGQLGRTSSSNENQSRPAVVDGLSGATTIVDVSGGTSHSLAVTESGSVWTWGNNQYGQLGNGTYSSRSYAQEVFRGYDIIKVDGGGRHSIALSSAGEVYAWGDNSYGQLGDGTSISKKNPIYVDSLSSATPVSDIAAGYYHNIALKDGGMQAWGSNLYGQLGDNTTVSKNYAVDVWCQDYIIAIDAGAYHSIALDENGTVWTWGDNSYGQLGDGTTTSRTTPQAVTGLSNVIAIAAGDYHSIAVKSDGTVWAWGNNSYGQLGDGTYNQRKVPVQMIGVTNAVKASAGRYNSAIISSSNDIYTCGDNSNNQLGNAIYTSYTTKPIQVFSTILLEDASNMISAGSSSNIAVKEDGTVWTWGENWMGQLGDGTTINRSIPTKINLSNIKEVSAGSSNGLALSNDGEVWAWGYNGYGQLGDGTNADKNTPIKLNLSNIVSVSAGFHYSLALASDGTVWAWGSNDYGQLGDNTKTNRSLPVKVNGLSNIVQVACGSDSSYALASDGTVWAWGRNNHGQLGDGTNVSKLLPAKVLSLSGVVRISASHDSCLVIRNDRTVWAWGYNLFGQLGDGTSTTRYTPVMVSNSQDAVDISCGDSNSMVLKRNKTVWICGSNFYGQCGNDSVTSLNTLTQSYMKYAIDIAAGDDHAIALKEDGTVWAWGRSQFGQLGNGSYRTSAKPVQAYNLTLFTLKYSYIYDENNRLLEIRFKGMTLLKYEYDKNGNLIRKYRP